jgi:metallophosphoesterase superfamily enzyme
MATSKPLRTEVYPGVWIDARRALFVAPLRILIIADIHWGFAAAHRIAGNLLPLWGDQEIALTLSALIADYQPREMVWLGDSLHAFDGRRPAEEFLAQLAPTDVSVSVVIGNHDRRWTVPSARTLQRERYFLHHGDAITPELPPDAIEVLGHFHPAVGWHDGAGTRLRIPALVASSNRLILPAFSPWAAGVPWNHKLRDGEMLWAVAPSRIFVVRDPQPRTPPAS